MSFKTNVDFPRNPVQGNSLQITLTVDANLTDYKCRCEIQDDTENALQLATVNAGGTSGDVTITPGSSSSTIVIVIAKDDTDDFEEDCEIEVEIESSSGVCTTIFKHSFTLKEGIITWTSPS